MKRVMIGCVLALAAGLAGEAYARSVPVPLPERPGNVSLEGETASVALSDAFAPAVRWEAVGLEGQRVAQGVCAGGIRKIELGRVPLGWYRIDGLDASGKRVAWTAAAVLKKLAAPVPVGSPVHIDTANAWFTRTGTPEGDRGKMAAFANLAALAGVSGARDRLTWGELEPSPGAFNADTRYDDSARILRGAGLEVLQVFHSTPAWAQTPRLENGDAYKRYPRDLRDAYRFCRAMAGRFKGAIQAWEPWNEANIPGFGGQLIDEMCALQKASYLGFKAGDPALTVCWNVYAGSGSKLHAQGVVDSVCWPYYDTYNNHSYSGVEQYANEFETAREGACGKPLWISECGIHARWDGERGDLSEGEELRQARFVPKSYASSLFAGVSRHYFFILGNYCEGQIQFGLLRHDLTPRRGYLALAAVGRLLAGAQPLGRMTNGAARVYAFRAQPDGAARDVLVAWADAGPGGAGVPVRDATGDVFSGVAAEAVYDVYGRMLPDGLPRELTESPVFAVLPPGGAARLVREQPLRVAPAPERLAPSPVVMQAVMPQAQARLDVQAYEIGLGVEETVPVALYNFGETTVRGKLALDAAPAGWQISLPDAAIELRSMERQVVALKAMVPPQAGRDAIFGATVRLRGAFGRDGQPVLAFRLACAAEAVVPSRAVPVAAAAAAEAWRDNIVGGATMTHAAQDGRMLFTMNFGGQDPWGYPRLALGADGRPPVGAAGLMVEIDVLEGEGALRVQFMEDSGACYLGELPYDFKKGGRQKKVVFFEKADWGGHSKPDPDGTLTPAEIHGVMVGINAKRDSRVRFAVGSMHWVTY